MSSETAIRVERLGKRYLLGETQGLWRYRMLREDVAGLFSRRGARHAAERELWALRELSFEIRAGETVGVIGRNGAGKSTLLKLIARITPPTTGRGETYGRVGSLLEVGTGFHPELTGRENILLSAAVMGMRRAEVLSRYDEIVEFSGLANFLDTPVKRYSTGMYMRLAFSVAAHLEPEILLVDEVLAVGDAEFQKKCLGRMEELGGTGRTVVFVSHSMPSVLRLCPRVLLLDEGNLVADGTGSEVVGTYLDTGKGSSAVRTWRTPQEAPGDDRVKIKAIRILNENQIPASEIDIRQHVYVEIEYWNFSQDPSFRPISNFRFFGEGGVCLFLAHDATNLSWWSRPRRPGVVCARCRIPGNFLAEGHIYVDAVISSWTPPETHCHVTDAVAFMVVDPSEGDGVRGEWTGNYPGVVRPMFDWQILEQPSVAEAEEWRSPAPSGSRRVVDSLAFRPAASDATQGDHGQSA
jgi:lipopolysaccharide transport system ATP-binding protein